MSEYDNTQEDNVSEQSFPIAEELAKKETQQKERHVPVAGQFGIAFGILVLAFAGTYIPDIIDRFTDPDANQTASVGDSPTAEERVVDAFLNLGIEAKSAFVWDVKNQRALFNKNADEQLPLASVAKLMTALVAYELLGTDTNVAVTLDAIFQEGDSGLFDGEQFTSQNLTDLTLINSSNDGAYALAEAGEGVLDGANETFSFIDVMNMRADEIGLSQTYFQNPTGLDVSESKSGAYGSARDMAFLMEYLVTNYPNILEYTKDNEMLVANTNGETHEAANTNAVTTKITGLLASKTGYTALAGGNLVIAFDVGLNHPVIVSVLGSSSLGRFTDVLHLVNATQVVLKQ